VLDLRLYRVTLLPFAVLMVIAAFSLHAAAVPANAPAAETFDGGAALTELTSLAGAYPDRAPGSAADYAMARAIAHSPAPHGLADAGFTSVRTVVTSIETTSGAAAVPIVIATRAGSGAGSSAGIALIADRGGTQSGDTTASLAPTATLLELAAIFKTLVPARPLTLVSTGGGASAMSAVAGLLPPDTEAAIVIGDVGAGHGPYVVPWSATGSLAPVALRRAVEAALGATLGVPVGDVSLTQQMARLALPLSPGEQGLLGSAGIPAVLVTANGEQAAAGSAAPSAARLGAFGQGLLGVTTELDAAGELATAPTSDLSFGSQVLGGGAVRAVIGALLLSLLVCTLDVVARARRRRIAVGRWLLWVLSLVAPFALALVFAALLGAGGLLPATPAAAVTPAQLPVDGSGAAALVSIGLLFVLAWVLRGASAARRRSGPPEPLGASAALLVVATVTSALLWLHDPYTAALLIVPAHIWLVVLTREHHDRAAARGALVVAVSLLPLAAVVALICSMLHTEPLGLLWTLVLAAAGGGLPPVGILLLSLTAGCFVAAAAVLLRGGAGAAAPKLDVTVRGPLSYAGPGSLGGTESALHR
jgi:hypothetical protein